MYDEKYLTFGDTTLAGNSGFYTKDFQGSLENIKYKGVTKFQPKMLVWCAISEPVIEQICGQVLNAER